MACAGRGRDGPARRAVDQETVGGARGCALTHANGVEGAERKARGSAWARSESVGTTAGAGGTPKPWNGIVQYGQCSAWPAAVGSPCAASSASWTQADPCTVQTSTQPAPRDPPRACASAGSSADIASAKSTTQRVARRCNGIVLMRQILGARLPGARHTIAAVASAAPFAMPAASVAPVALAHACRLVNHGPTVLVSTAHGGQRNVMAAAWSMPVEFSPPRIAVVVDKSTYTRELLLAADGFALNLPCRAQADLTYTVGSESGRDGDKFARHGIVAFDGPALGLPLVDGCVAWLECRRIAEPHSEAAYDTFFGEVVSAHADTRVFADGRWRFADDNAALHTLHHLGGGLFALPAATVQGQRLQGRAG
jgi:flavin reductase (DIM6/NTAB) family NADH-FMN oxidoreductase RutF